MRHLSAPRSALCARDSSPSAKTENGDVARRFPAFSHPPRAPWRNGRKGLPFGRCPSRRTMPTHPPSTAPLCAAQARPARRPGHEAKGPVRRRAASPVLLERDHFPRTLVAKAHVLTAPQAPIPPRCNALQCMWGIVGTGSEGEEKAGVFSRELRGCRGAWILGSAPEDDAGREGRGREAAPPMSRRSVKRGRWRDALIVAYVVPLT